MNKTYLILPIILFLLFISPLSVSAAWPSDGSESFTQQQVNQWRHDNGQKQQLIAQLSPTPVTNLTIPVLFGVAVKNLTRNFGDPRAGHTHEGLDIMAAEGLPVVTPTDAVVVHIGFDAGAGNFVTTAVPGGESFVYMHLSKVAAITENTMLKPGDLIGYVGHTGNAVATAPHLHFEVHDQTGTAVDPFPRLTMELSLAQKIQYLTQVLNNDPIGRDALSDLLIAKAKADFVAAKTQGLVLPEAISAALLRNAIATGTSTTTVTAGNSTGTLKVGSRGPLVVTLQTFLIRKNVGSASRVVADGSFGPITKQALIDYQVSVGLVADGVYGPKSAAYVVAHQ